VPAQYGMSERRVPVRRRFEVFEMHMVIYALVEVSTEDEALSTGKAVFERLVGADPHACAVFDYFVTFDDEDTTVAGKARWGDLPIAAAVDSEKGQDCFIVVGKQRKRSSSGISTK